MLVPPDDDESLAAALKSHLDDSVSRAYENLRTTSFRRESGLKSRIAWSEMSEKSVMFSPAGNQLTAPRTTVES
jgi:hypothetical protein